jgi:uncharacterized protein YbjQ (UPF0145 family)
LLYLSYITQAKAASLSQEVNKIQKESQSRIDEHNKQVNADGNVNINIDSESLKAIKKADEDLLAEKVEKLYGHMFTVM